MASQVAVSKLAVRPMDQPDERRTPDKTNVEVMQLEGYTLGRITMAPGWRWSECIKPVVGTDLCRLSHIGYAISGRLTVRLDDGREETIGSGSAYTIPPGHDAWVEGGEAFVGLEMMSADQYAKR